MGGAPTCGKMPSMYGKKLCHLVEKSKVDVVEGTGNAPQTPQVGKKIIV